MLRVIIASSKKLGSQQIGQYQKCGTIRHNSSIRSSSCLLTSSSSISSSHHIFQSNPSLGDASTSRKQYRNEQPLPNMMMMKTKRLPHQQHGRMTSRLLSTAASPLSFTSNRHPPKWMSPHHHSMVVSHRCFSAATGSENNNNDFNDTANDDDFAASSSSSVDDTLERLFAENMQDPQIISDAMTTAIATIWEPTWYNVADQAVVAVKAFHELTGIEYGWSIVGVTMLLRLGLFPLMIQSQRTTTRMAHLQPELNLMKDRYEAIGTPSRQEQIQFTNKVKALFAKYQVKPSRAFMAPVIQIPLFMGMFFGLRKMPDIYPNELATGGMFWFENLNNPDPLYILPVLSGLSFFAVIELGKNDMAATMSPGQGQLMVNVFRFMSLGMIPLIAQFDSAMLCYWSANNLLTLGQTALLKQKSVRAYFGIWERPKPVPGATSNVPSMKDMMENLVKKSRGQATSEKEEMERHNQAVETKKKATRMMDAARDKRRGITGRRNG